MLAVLDNPALEPIASEARERLARVIQRLGASQDSKRFKEPEQPAPEYTV